MRFHSPKVVTAPARLPLRKAVASGVADLWMLVKHLGTQLKKSYLKSRWVLIHGLARSQLLSVFHLLDILNLLPEL